MQVNYRTQNNVGTWFPFVRWNYFDGARKFARNAPAFEVNEVDAGVEFAKWAEVEVTGMFTHTFRRTRTSTFPFGLTRDANRVACRCSGITRGWLGLGAGGWGSVWLSRCL